MKRYYVSVTETLNMVVSVDAESENEDRAYLEEWYFKAFGTYNIKYDFGNYLEEVHSMMEEDYEEA